MKTETLQSVATLAVTLSRRAVDKSPASIAADAVELRKLSVRIASQAVRYCNGDLESDAWERRGVAAKAKGDAILSAYGLESRIGGDPRGYTFHLLALPGAPAIRGNTWGGDESGYGI